MSPQKILSAAAGTLPKRWAKGSVARDANGNREQPDSLRAVAWCVTVHIERAAKGHDYMPAIALLASRINVHHERPMQAVVNWADAPERTEVEVIAALKGGFA